MSKLDTPPATSPRPLVAHLLGVARSFDAYADEDSIKTWCAEAAAEIERLRAGWIEADKIALEARIKDASALSEIEPRQTAALHACEGLDTADLAGNDKGWLAEVVHDAARVERELNNALRARCPGNGDEPDPVRCQCYEASEQGAPCPPGCCAMADEKDVRALLAAVEEEGAAPSATRRTLAPNVDGQDFYELCQGYRHSKEISSHPGLPNTVQAFNNLREYIKTGKLPWPSYEEPK